MNKPLIPHSPFRHCVAGIVCMILTATFVRSDWDPVDSSKWVQLPDLTPQGMDVKDLKWGTLPLSSRTLADDWRCTVTEPITNIHIWGSWYKDDWPQDYTQSVAFVLAIHADIPANPPNVPFSKPGAVLWAATFYPGTFTARQYAIMTQGVEGWFEPGASPFYDPNGDLFCWQYNFPIASNGFTQEGTPAAPVVYWLEVQAFYPIDVALTQFGWKTSTNHWNDAAVYATGFAPYNGPGWDMLLYPDGHPYEGQKLDLAFVINGGAGDYDFGDAPYPTLLANNGARHVIVAQGPYLGPAGDQPDPEADGQPNPTASGDDVAGATPDDENGVVIPLLQVGVATPITIIVGQSGWVDGWIDWNGDGLWQEPAERVAGAILPAGPNPVWVTAPGPYTGQTFARFRIHTGTSALLPTGPASDGEVEDYMVVIEQGQEAYDFGDAPDGTAAPGYPTLLANNGARHLITASSPYFGGAIDAPDSEPDGQPNATATGDDVAGAMPDDENGVTFPTFVAGQSGTAQVTVSHSGGGAGGWVDAWIDWNADGDWNDAGEQIRSGPLITGTWTLGFAVPPGTAIGRTFARFRIHSGTSALPPTGPASDGEVEDYTVWVEPAPVPPDPQAKWWQSPDLTTNGLDVADTYPLLLADDFQCTNRTAITNIVVWGSWRKDILPSEGAGAPTFFLSFHSDIPAGAGGLNYSMPGTALWWIQYPPGSYSVQVEHGELQEGWYNPQEQEYLPWSHPGDTVCYRYTFQVPLVDAFVQTGTVNNPIIYWLDVQAMPVGTEPAQFGWKTSTMHWNDDATWALGGEPYNGIWSRLVYPPLHPLYNRSMFDLAFALYGVPVEPPPESDFGDAPDPTYPTLLANDGARHTLSQLILGALIDAEADGQPTPGANGDDLAGAADEDGVSFPAVPFTPGTSGSVTVTSSGSGYLDAWIDFNQDGDWFDSGERIATSAPVVAGANAISFAVPGGALSGRTCARFRLSSAGGLMVTGAAPDGEVEDYFVSIGDPLLDFGDAPDGVTALGYPTLLINNGGRHYLRGTLYMGTAPDSEADGQPNANATGDDLAGVDDEDGVNFLTPFYRGETARMRVTVSAAGKLDAWINLNADSDWSEPGEQMAASQAVTAGVNIVSFFVPGTATKAATFTRFRLSTAGGLAPTGLADDGEVEDYAVTVEDRFPPGVGPKWFQPPDLRFGIDIQSWGYEQEYGPYLVADDWWCDGRPIDALRWWGSYLAYGGVSNAPGIPVGGLRPSGFRLHWYADVPSTNSPTGYSTPGGQLLSRDVPLLSFTQPLDSYGVVKEVYAGTVDLSFLGPPYIEQLEHKFRYDLYLEESWNEKAGNIYWLGIEALYGGEPRGFPWGWSTTPFRRNWNDDAVVRTNDVTGAPVWGEMTYLPNVPPFDTLERHPYIGRSVNMAFQLFSRVTPRRAYIWRQPPDMINGTDLVSWRCKEGSMPPGFDPTLRADDWLSEGRRVSNIHWWGSYINWEHTVGEPVMPPPTGAINSPLGFKLSWHEDGLGGQPGAVITNLFVPLEYCHQTYYCCVTQDWWRIYEHEYQYYVDLLDPRVSGVPWSVVANERYWLDVQAFFPQGFNPSQGEMGHYGWGWKTTPELQGNSSVVATNNSLPFAWDQGIYPAGHPFAGKPADLAFELTTDKVGTNRWHMAPNIVAIVPGAGNTCTVLVASVGDVLAGEQQLRMERDLTNMTFSAMVDELPVPFPPPATNWFTTVVATNLWEFYRIYQVNP